MASRHRHTRPQAEIENVESWENDNFSYCFNWMLVMTQTHVFKIVPWNSLLLFHLQLISLLSHHPPPTTNRDSKHHKGMAQFLLLSTHYRKKLVFFFVSFCFVSCFIFICWFSDSDLGFVFSFAECIARRWWPNVDGFCLLLGTIINLLIYLLFALDFFYALCMHAC